MNAFSHELSAMMTSCENWNLPSLVIATMRNKHARNHWEF